MTKHFYSFSRIGAALGCIYAVSMGFGFGIHPLCAGEEVSPSSVQPATAESLYVAPVDGSAGATAAAPQTPIERGLKFLKDEAYRWKASKGCAACHHSALVLWTFNEARARGISVDGTAYDEINLWTLDGTRTNATTPQPPPRDVINLGATYALLSVETAPASAIDPFLETRHWLREYIAREQEADGSWGIPLDLRVPLGGPPEDIAILSRIALIESADKSTTTTKSLDKAADWLSCHHDNESRQARNLLLMMDFLEGAPPEQLSPSIAAIKAEQNADGGWSQTPEMASDAYATGQTLYILVRVGIKPGDPQLTRGVEFLTASQREDGSWPMISRVNSKDMTPITATGAAWAVLGLVRALP